MLTTNQIKEFSKLRHRKYREISNKFLIEGEHLIDECLKSESFPGRIKKVLISSGFQNKSLIERIKKAKITIEVLKEIQFNKISETENSQGIIAVVSFSGYNRKDFPKGLIIALENINDPGNLGTILRTAWWFGVKNIIIGRNSVEVLNAKTIRASQGAIFNIDIQSDIDLKEYLLTAVKNEYEVFLTTLKSKNYLSDFKYKKEDNVIIVFGNEANGISDDLISLPSVNNIKIQGLSNCESLNVAQSVAIFLYHFKSVN
jgi:TrmH family RNA methyltransferase